jgi:hypothetical protein
MDHHILNHLLLLKVCLSGKNAAPAVLLLMCSRAGALSVHGFWQTLLTTINELGGAIGKALSVEGNPSATMARILVILGLVLLLVGLLWPYLSRIGLGRLPGDLVIQRDNVTFYFPLMTCLLLSLLLSLISWAVNR